MMKRVVFLILLVLMVLNCRSQSPGLFVYVIVKDSLILNDTVVKYFMSDTLVNTTWVRGLLDALDYDTVLFSYYSDTSDYSDTSGYSFYSNYADTSGQADTASYSLLSDSSDYSDTTGYAFKSDTANYAEDADTINKFATKYDLSGGVYDLNVNSAELDTILLGGHTITESVSLIKFALSQGGIVYISNATYDGGVTYNSAVSSDIYQVVPIDTAYGSGRLLWVYSGNDSLYYFDGTIQHNLLEKGSGTVDFTGIPDGRIIFARGDTVAYDTIMTYKDSTLVLTGFGTDTSFFITGNNYKGIIIDSSIIGYNIQINNGYSNGISLTNYNNAGNGIRITDEANSNGHGIDVYHNSDSTDQAGIHITMPNVADGIAQWTEINNGSEGIAYQMTRGGILKYKIDSTGRVFMGDSLYLEFLNSPTRWGGLYIDSITGAVKVDSVVLSSLGLTDELISLKDLLADTLNGEIIWHFYSDNSRKVEVRTFQGLKQSEVNAIFQVALEHSFRYSRELEMKMEKLEAKVDELEIRIKKLEALIE